MPLVTHNVSVHTLRAEADILLCCARVQMDVESVSRLKTRLNESIDWEYLIRLAKRHALLPLLYKNLAAVCPLNVPEVYMAQMRNYFRHNHARNLLLTGELCRILKVFEASDIKAIPYKGPMLALQLYGSLALRRFTDLDLLIQRRDVIKAKDLLLARGYRLSYQLTSAQQEAYLDWRCEHVFLSEDDRLTLEIHWKFILRYYSISLAPEPMWSRLESVRLNDMEALSFGAEDLLLILCVNASKDLWSKLGSLCDIAELVKAHPDLDWGFVMQEATKAGIERLFLLGLYLAQSLLRLPLPESIRKKIEADSAIESLAAEVIERLFENDAAPRSFLQMTLFHLRSRERLLDRIRFCDRLLRTSTPGDWAFVSLPRRLFFLYHLIRPLRILKDFRSSQTKNSF
jgi:hypothetical protein